MAHHSLFLPSPCEVWFTVFSAFSLHSITAEMVQRLGSIDLAVAHMVCNLGGRVQFVGGPRDHWHQRYNKSPPDLPSTYTGDLKLEAIDLSGTSVMYEGFKWLRESSLSLSLHHAY